ncbi:serine carboxypeptidase family protein, partial [mine drainage metagenome]
VTINGKHIDYTADTGTIILHDKQGKPTGEMFYVAYIKRGVDAAKRPISFLYNGGPGSSSVWLHMGAFGPVRVVTDSHIHTPPAPYRLVNNDYSLLNASDLVFVDAMGTGYSRILGKAEG